MIVKLLYYAVFIGVVAVVFNVMQLLDLNKRVYNHKPGKCDVVQGPVDGSEDIEFIKGKNIAFITSGIYYMFDRPGVVGKIFLYDFNDPTGKFVARELKIVNRPKNFHPHGLSSWSSDGKITLYVISHSKPAFKHSVEVFNFDSDKQILTHIKTITNSAFIRPNDLFVVGPNQFVFTNDGTAQTSILNAIEILTQVKAGSVGYFDGKKVNWLVKSDKSPNGIWVDVRKMILYVASPNGETIKVYKLTEGYRSVNLISTVNLLSSPDNLFLDDDGDLWTAGHPVLFALLSLDACSSDTRPAPSQVLRIRFSEDYKQYEVTEPYTNDGREIACSSVAIRNSNRLLIGTVSGKMLHCEIAHPDNI